MLKRLKLLNLVCTCTKTRACCSVVVVVGLVQRRFSFSYRYNRCVTCLHYFSPVIMRLLVDGHILTYFLTLLYIVTLMKRCIIKTHLTSYYLFQRLRCQSVHIQSTRDPQKSLGDSFCSVFIFSILCFCTAVCPFLFSHDVVILYLTYKFECPFGIFRLSVI